MKTDNEIALRNFLESLLQKHLDQPLELLEFSIPDMKDKILNAMEEAVKLTKEAILNSQKP